MTDERAAVRRGMRAGALVGALIWVVVLAFTLWIARHSLGATLLAVAGFVAAAIGFVMWLGARKRGLTGRAWLGAALVLGGLVAAVVGLVDFVAERVERSPQGAPPTGALGYSAAAAPAPPARSARLPSS